MSPTQFALYEALWEQIDAPAGKVEALLELMQSFTAETRPRGRVLHRRFKSTSTSVRIALKLRSKPAKASWRSAKQSWRKRNATARSAAPASATPPQSHQQPAVKS